MIKIISNRISKNDPDSISEDILDRMTKDMEDISDKISDGMN